LKATATKIHTFRTYRRHKRRVNKPRAIIRVDRGQIEETISLVFPEKSQVTYTSTPKEPNPDLIRINFGQLSLIYYISTKRGFVYDKDRMYSGSFELHDLKHLYSRIGVSFKALKIVYGYSTSTTNKRKKNGAQKRTRLPKQA
jgi:hypothetical protein